jgi:hypothetical protein
MTLNEHRNLVYPTVDRTINGIATSIKSIDLDASSYQNAGGLGSALRRYINEIADFAERERAGRRLNRTRLPVEFSI